MHDDTHPDFDRCHTNLMNDMIRDSKFIENNKSRFACSLGPRQPPRTVRLTRKKKYKARLFGQQLQDANSRCYNV